VAAFYSRDGGCFVAEKEKKVVKVRVPEKKNFFSRIGDNIRRYFRETIGELRKVSWPTRQQALNLTGIVLIVIAAMTVFLLILDVTFAKLFTLILQV
jgi:preprotein translocase subunit SecE